MSSRAIYNLVRSLTKPYVGAHFVFNSQDFKVWKVKELPASDEIVNIEPGKVLEVNDDKTVDIKTYDGIIRLLEFDDPQFNTHFKKGDYLL